MTPAERLKLIQERAQRSPVKPLAKPSGLHRAANPNAPRIVVRKPYVRSLNSPNYNWYVGGEYCPTSDNRPPWVYQPDKPKPVQCKIKRKARVSPLTRIAEQLPKKLPMLPRVD